MVLKPHEIKVIEILLSDVISSSTMDCINNILVIADYYTTGHGYFLTIKHPNLPSERIVCHQPLIVGECKGVESTFLIFIEKHQLTIECAGMSEIELPEDYRDWDINVIKA